MKYLYKTVVANNEIGLGINYEALLRYGDDGLIEFMYTDISKAPISKHIQYKWFAVDQRAVEILETNRHVDIKTVTEDEMVLELI